VETTAFQAFFTKKIDYFLNPQIQKRRVYKPSLNMHFFITDSFYPKHLNYV